MKVVHGQGDAAGSETRTAKAHAMEFLQAALAGGPVPATQVGVMAQDHGLTTKAIRMGREALVVEIARNGFGPGGQSVWSLPGHMDAHPTPSQEGVSASREEPNLSETHQPKMDGYEVIGVEANAACEYCGQRGGPPGPQSGPVYLVCNPFNGRSEPLHEDCAGFWFEWLGKVAKEVRDRVLSHRCPT